MNTGTAARRKAFLRETSPTRNMMADDRTKVGPRDGQRVNVHEDYELRYWSEKWGVSAEQLRAAVEKVGPIARDVARQLGKSA
jgi:hypothetical protein